MYLQSLESGNTDSKKILHIFQDKQKFSQFKEIKTLVLMFCSSNGIIYILVERVWALSCYMYEISQMSKTQKCWWLISQLGTCTKISFLSKMIIFCDNHCFHLQGLKKDILENLIFPCENITYLKSHTRYLAIFFLFSKA